MQLTNEIGGNQTISGKYTTGEAAEVLGVTSHQVIELIHSGELTAARTAGDVFLIDAVSVVRYEQIRQGKGRPFSIPIAWAALWLLSGLEADWLSAQQKIRLDKRLCNISAESLAWIVRKRARLTRLRIDNSFLGKAQKSLVLSGPGSKRMQELGLAGKANHLEGYISERNIERFMRETFAVTGENTNAIVHVVEETAPISLELGAEMPIAVIAVDLIASSVERERSIGLDLLKGLLREKCS